MHDKKLKKEGPTLIDVIGIPLATSLSSRFIRPGRGGMYQLRHPNLQDRQILTNRMPYNLVIDTKVIVYQSIPHACHIPPWHERKSSRKVRGYFLRRLANNLQTPDHSPCHDRIFDKNIVLYIRRCLTTKLDLQTDMAEKLNQRWLHIPLRSRYDVRKWDSTIRPSPDRL